LLHYCSSRKILLLSFYFFSLTCGKDSPNNEESVTQNTTFRSIKTTSDLYINNCQLICIRIEFTVETLTGICMSIKTKICLSVPDVLIEI